MILESYEAIYRISYRYAMSKSYVKENGKWKLTENLKQEPQVIVNQEPKTQPLSLENVNERLLKIEELIEAMMKK